RLFDPLAAKRKLVRYDPRGYGLSDREADMGDKAPLWDLEAVVGSLGLDVLDLFGATAGGVTAVRYAAANPALVSRLIIMDSFARGADLVANPKAQALNDVLARDWEMYTQTVGGENFGWGSEAAARFAAMVKASVSQRTLLTLHKRRGDVDLTDLLPTIQAPTLVLRHSDLENLTLEMARELAAGIPRARLVMLDGKFGDLSDKMPDAINDFLDEDATSSAALPSPEGMTAILFLDIADSTALTTKLGDSAYREKERELDGSLRAAITEAGGTPVEGKVLGDGVMAVFTSARRAIEAAQRCRDLGNEAGLPLHLGIHAGDVVREGNNVHGGAVQVASRVQGAARPGEILVSATVRDLARTSGGVSFEDRGDHDLKGIAEPVRVFAVQEGER
ncbi:MAG: adenylate/guanylate cyclase domain-containing protein, partial [Dehalococcoidia bacterium]